MEKATLKAIKSLGLMHDRAAKELRTIIVEVESEPDPNDVQSAMEFAAESMNADSVEAIQGNPVDPAWGDTVALFVNFSGPGAMRGPKIWWDFFRDMTILYDVSQNKFFVVQSVQEWISKYGKRLGVV